VGTQTTNNQGTAEFCGLALGSYTVVQRCAPGGYEKNIIPQSVLLNPSCLQAVVDFTNVESCSF